MRKFNSFLLLFFFCFILLHSFFCLFVYSLKSVSFHSLKIWLSFLSFTSSSLVAGFPRLTTWPGYSPPLWLSLNLWVNDSCWWLWLVHLDYFLPKDFFSQLFKKRIKPLTPRSDQHESSPCDILTLNSKQLMRIFKLIR